MNKIDADLVAVAERYVMNLLRKRLSQEYVFHSITHTINVLRGAVQIGQCSGFSEDEMNILKVSALFHDVGYITTNEDHETESAFIAGELLRANLIDDHYIEQVQNAILATKVPQQPKDKISEVLCDADLLHLSSDDYFEQMELLRLEWQITGRYFFTEYEFHLHSIKFFGNHHYHSLYGKTVLEERKAEVLKRIIERAETLKEC
jgi:uncharacterized protein